MPCGTSCGRPGSAPSVSIPTLSDQGLYDGVRIVHERATSALGVRSTPTVYVGEQRQEGTLTADALGEVIARALEGRTGR